MNGSTAARVMSAESDEWTVEPASGQELRGSPCGTVQARGSVAWNQGSTAERNADSIGKRKEGQHSGQG